AYVWEDNNPETFSVAVNGQPVAANLSTGRAGAWAKLGPYAATVSNGTLRLTTSGGTVNLSGVEVRRQGTGGASSAASIFSAKVAGAGSEAAAKAAPVTLYPNPVETGQTQVQVAATVAQAEKMQVQVLTNMGVVVRRATLAFPAGTSSQPLSVGALPVGSYVVRFVSGSLAGTALNLLKKD
uniref:T9SS type A sorting domain-containing protein n=1 Tax=Hymenobacter sp. TaxID=1898978 RepID=UPI00286D3BED